MLRLTVVLLVALLAACSSQPPRQQALPSLSPTMNLPSAPSSFEAAKAQLPTASGERQRYILGWAEQYLGNNQINSADALLKLLQPQQLQGSQRLHWILLMAQVKLTQQQPDAATALLNDQQLGIPKLLAKADANVRARTQLLRAAAMQLQGDLVGSIKQRVAIDPLLPPDSQQYNEKMIWNSLMRLPASAFNQALDNSHGDAKGWFSLAKIYRTPLANIGQQALQVEAWMQRWHNHPAAYRVPAAIQALRHATHQRFNKVAVLLPLSGKLAEPAAAIRDGLLSAYYHALSQQQTLPQLFFIDSSEGNIVSHYQAAVRRGAQLVLGPLSKAKVAELQSLSLLKAPLLTFNYSPNKAAPTPANFYQYGLAPEDEVRQIVAQAWREGKRQAGIFYPNDNWGSRMANAFAAAWQAKGGKIVAAQTYDHNLEQVVPNFLLVNRQPEQHIDTPSLGKPEMAEGAEPALSREELIRKKLPEGKQLRQDMDFVFLVANAKKGRQIKPLFNFYFAAQQPIIALSYIYQGEANPIKDRDLNGIRFVEIPWVLRHDSQLHQQASQWWPDHHGMYQSLYAMGLDSFRLIGYLPLLSTSPDIQLPGQTGRLSLDHNQRIRRTLDWAIFRQGLAQPLPVVVSHSSSR